MQIIEKNIDELTPYENNPRKNDKSVDYVANSISQFGFKVPIVIDSNGVIVAGHTRYKAAVKLKMHTIPCIVADDLTEEQIKAFRLADNKVGEFSEWDFDLLSEELDGIFNLDMSNFGFDLSFDDEEQEIVEDDFDGEPPEKPNAKRGDIYQLGRHRLMCGDSTSAEDVSELLNGVKTNMIFTDPPYGYNYQSNMREKSQKFDLIENDDKILDFFPQTKEVCIGFVFICTTWKVLDKWLPLFQQYFDLSNMIIWNKGGGGIGDLKHTFSTDYEIILCSNNGAEIKGKRIGSVWSVGKDCAESYKHPTQKPVGLSAMAIKNCTEKNDNILDLFGGSGSTLIACEQLNRTCYMMELEPKYIDVIIERWEKLTGGKAVLLNGKTEERN